MDRGEMPIEPGDSWFSPKCMEVQPFLRARFGASRACRGGRALDGLGGAIRLPTPLKPQMPVDDPQESDGGG